MTMRTSLKKFTGWILLLAGVSIILWSLYSSYNIFTAKVPAPEIFKVKEEEVLSQKERTESMDEQMKEMIGEQIEGIFPRDAVPQLLNLVSWSIFAGILIFGGTQLSNLGIKLIKR